MGTKMGVCCSKADDTKQVAAARGGSTVAVFTPNMV